MTAATSQRFIEILKHHRIHRCEVAEICQINSQLHYVIEIASGGFGHSTQIIENLPGSRFEVSFNQLHLRRVEWNLAGNKYQTFCLNRLGICSDSGGGVVSVQGFL